MTRKLTLQILVVGDRDKYMIALKDNIDRLKPFEGEVATK